MTHSLNISNRISHSSVGDKVSRGYLINNNNVPRLIGKGGGTIKQIQREYDVQIKVSNDRQNQWVDLTISGSNDEAIQNAFNHIENIVGAIKEKNEYFQLHTVSNIGMLVLFSCFVAYANHDSYGFYGEHFNFIFIFKTKEKYFKAYKQFFFHMTN